MDFELSNFKFEYFVSFSSFHDAEVALTCYQLAYFETASDGDDLE